MDEHYWTEHTKFNPDRFLDKQGKVIVINPAAFIPFGTGRRICLGEQMAINDLFVILVRFIQLAQNYRIELSSSQTTLEPNISAIQRHLPIAFDMVVKP